MLADALGGAAFAEWVLMFVLILSRLSFVVFLMPGIGEQVVPARVRLFLLLGISFAIAASGIVKPETGGGTERLFELILNELLIGLVIGLSLRLSIWVLSIAGSIIAQSIGLSQFLGVALDQEAQTLTANLLSMAGVVLLLSVNYHVTAFALIINLYTDVPTGLEVRTEQATLLTALLAAFSFAVLLAWPFVAVNLIYNICLGFINKALPQMMVAFVGAPFLVGAGVVLLAASIASLLVLWIDRVPTFASWL